MIVKRFKDQFSPAMYFIRKYKRQSILVSIMFLISGLVEGIGFTALIPLMNITLGNDTVANSGIASYLVKVFATFGVPFELIYVLILIFTMMLLKGIANYLALCKVAHISQDIVADLRSDIVRAVLGSKWDYLSSMKAGELTTALSSEVEKVSNVYLTTGKTLANIVPVTVYLFLAINVSFSVALGAIVICGISLFILKKFLRQAKSASQKGTDQAISMNSFFVDFIRGMKQLKASSREESIQKVMDVEINSFADANKKRTDGVYAVNHFQEPVQVLIVCICLYVFLNFLKLNPDNLFLLLLLFYRTAQRLSFIQIYYQTYLVSIPAYEFIFGLINGMKKEEEESTGDNEFILNKEIQIQNLSFSYPGKDVLRSLNLSIKKGSAVIFKGTSGSGKTTFIDLLIRLRKPKSGKILIDGVNLEDIDKESIRKKIVYMGQEPFMFNDTLRNNFWAFDPTLKDEEIWSSLERVGAKKFVSALPDKLDSQVGETGSKLSGGQKQRVVLARTLLLKPEVLILDESTSALDEASEQVIINTLKDLKGKMTIIAISHQKGIEDICDEVIDLTLNQSQA